VVAGVTTTASLYIRNLEAVMVSAGLTPEIRAEVVAQQLEREDF